MFGWGGQGVLGPFLVGAVPPPPAMTLIWHMTHTDKLQKNCNEGHCICSPKRQDFASLKIEGILPRTDP